jgi:hypothetical protein
MVSVAEGTPALERERAGGGLGELARDIARGGLAGLVAGVVVGGLGGRAVMRLAALLVPDSAGRLTENGNRIGAITLDGALPVRRPVRGIAAGIVWVTVRPGSGNGIHRRPGHADRRALSGLFLIAATTSIFSCCGMTLVVASLIG